MATDPLNSPNDSRLFGVAFGLSAGALWGLVFLAPELARGFPPLSLTVGRYLAYGVVAAALIAPRMKALLPKLGRREWLALGWLSVTGNTAYYLLLSAAVQTGGIAMTSLVIGFLPVAVTLIGSRDHGAVSIRRLAPSLLFCAGGALCIGWQAIGAPTASSLRAELFGFACAVGALGSWTTYAVGNSRGLARLSDVSAHDWSLLTGLVTGAQALLLVPLAIVLDTAGHSATDWGRLGGISIAVALLASIAGNALWNRMSRLLPLTLVGQMILFETLFALIYGFLWDHRLPKLLEIAAFVLVTLSVVSSVSAHREKTGAQAVE